jgi:hypothetical protein
MKKLIKSIFYSFYNWQSAKWGESSLPAFIALVLLSAMQFANLGCLLIIVQTITKIDIFDYLGEHIYIVLILQAIIFFFDFQIIKPIKETIRGTYDNARVITGIYTIATILVFGLTLYFGRKFA